MKERVVNLEAQQPHINAALARIETNFGLAINRVETSIRSLNGHISKAIWLFAGLLAAAVVKFIVGGGLSRF